MEGQFVIEAYGLAISIAIGARLGNKDLEGKHSNGGLDGQHGNCFLEGKLDN